MAVIIATLGNRFSDWSYSPLRPLYSRQRIEGPNKEEAMLAP
jgi:hypothetical protein